MTDFFIDIGNTRIKYTPNQPALQLQFSQHGELAPIFQALAKTQPTRLLIAAGRSPSAQQAQDNLIAHAQTHHITTAHIMVQPDMLSINYQDHKQFGADRFLNLLAARERYGKNFCVISAGTAITLDFYTDRHIGGMILLGLGSMKSILSEKTGLPDISKPQQLLGNDTATSIGAGIYLGLQNSITQSVARVEKEQQRHFHTVWTGGDADLLHASGDNIPTLLFEGMAYYTQINSTM